MCVLTGQDDEKLDFAALSRVTEAERAAVSPPSSAVARSPPVRLGASPAGMAASPRGSAARPADDDDDDSDDDAKKQFAQLAGL